MVAVFVALVIALHRFAPVDSGFEVHCLGTTTDVVACLPAASAEKRVFSTGLVFNTSLLTGQVSLKC